jgi:hypothetical protein
MWRYDNVRFIYSNEVASVFGQEVTIPFLFTYVKSKFALMEALRAHIDVSFLGPYAEIDPKSVKYNTPYKV